MVKKGFIGFKEGWKEGLPIKEEFRKQGKEEKARKRVPPILGPWVGWERI